MNKSEMKEAPSAVPADSSGVAAEALSEDTTAMTSMSRAVVEVTNRRYQNDCFWGGPKGLKYGLLVGALPIQQPVLYPDQGSTYFVGQFKLPKGSSLMIRGEFPHLRYFSYTVAAQLGGGQLGNGDFLRDDQIKPDEGSFNPFLQSSSRRVTPRHYTLQVVQGDPPRLPRGAATQHDLYLLRFRRGVHPPRDSQLHSGRGLRRDGKCRAAAGRRLRTARGHAQPR